MTAHIEAASAAYAMAAAIDAQMPEPTKLRIQAWAALFEGQGIGPEDAVAAVKAYYRRPGRFPIKPGDVIAGVAALPVTSSPARIEAFLDRWSQHPYSQAIQQMTGLDWSPPWPPPAAVSTDDPDALVAFHRREFQRWIDRNRARLVAKALANGEQLELQ
ncbi:hypothetical protein [Nocardia sp. MW-W600-9]